MVTHKGGSSDHGVSRLYLNGRELGVVGDNHTKDTTYQVEFLSGSHMIGWVLTGGAIGGGNTIQFVDSRTNQPLLVHVPAEAAAQVGSARCSVRCFKVSSRVSLRKICRGAWS